MDKGEKRGKGVPGPHAGHLNNKEHVCILKLNRKTVLQAEHISDCRDDGDSSDMYTPVLQPASSRNFNSNGQLVQICAWSHAHPDASHRNCCPALILQTEALCPTQHNRVHFSDVLPGQSLDLVLKTLSVLHAISEYSGRDDARFMSALRRTVTATTTSAPLKQ